MKKFLLILAAMAVVGGQSSFAQTKVLKLSAETSKLNVAQVSEAEGEMQMSRYLFAGYNTLCLPISVSADQLKEQLPGVKLERLGAIRQEGSTLCLYFVDCTNEGVEAGMPYLVYSPQKKYLRVNSNGARRLAADASAVRMNDGQGNQVNFSGSWETRLKEGLYGIPAQQNREVLESVLIRTTAEQAFRPTRCSFNWESQSATAANLEIRHVSTLADATGVKSLNAADALVDVYDLKGNILVKQVKLSDAKASLPAGIYVIGGEKVTIK